MRAVVLRRHGPPGVLSIEDVPDPEAGAEQVVVAVRAIGLNFAEVLSRKGRYGWVPKRPYVLGMEAAGTIEAVGDAVAGRTVGEQVLVGTKFGAYAEKVAVPAARALPAVEGYSMEQNAAFGVNFMTAWIALMELARVRRSDRVLVTAAAGGVGTAAVQIAHAYGCEVVALAGSESKLELARSMGADVTVRYGDPGFPGRLREAVGPRGVDVALETVAGDVFRAVNDVIAPFGRIVAAGYAGIDYRLWNPLSWWRAWRGAPRMTLESMYKGSKGLLSTHLGYLIPDERRMERVWDGLVDFARAHELRPHVGHVLPFEEVAEAHRLLESRESVGKVVLRL